MRMLDLTIINKIQPVILCGGSGTRLWPLSRAGFPKQFLSITGNQSLFQQAVRRITNINVQATTICKPLIVTGENHRFLALEQLRELKIDLGVLVLEPVARNTAPALTLASLAAQNDGDDPILIVTPADHVVKNDQAFNVSIKQAIKCASSGAIVVLGITPNRPETGYGYIRVIHDIDKPWSKVEEFVEKPNEKNAKEYLLAKEYFWNAGIFVMRASVWIRALQMFRQDIAEATKLSWDHRTEDKSINSFFIRPGVREFTSVPSDSIDYAVMERCTKSNIPVQMVELDAGWSDLGAWDAVWDIMLKDKQDNASVGDVIISGGNGNLVHANSRLVALVGVNDLVVTETPDAILIANKYKSDEVKSIISELEKTNRDEHILHRKVYRPWGWYDIIDEDKCFKVKRIRVNPGASLSLQKHKYRAEHWIIVRGEAEVNIGGEVKTLFENQSTYIPLGEIHRLKNCAEEPLEIIEVQSGEYLGEDDIIRFEDNYGRIK